MKLVNPGKIPAVWVSLIPFAFLAATLSIVIKIFGGSALDGASQVSLLLASGVVVAISMIFYKVKWEDFENGIMDNIRSVSSAILILFLIGAVAGTWMASGIVPMMIYYGMKIITPKIFLFATCAICALISVMTGSSWTTIATVGVALIGIGTAHGYSAGWTAGAIISGAYFGDKISPLSDTTTLASSAAGTPLFTHIRYMLLTTIPSFVIALIIFLAVSLTHETSSQSTIAEFAGDLASCFNINHWLLLVPVITGVLIVRKMPAILTLFVAILLAAAAALIFQPHIVWHIASGEPLSAYRHLSFMDGFKGLMLTTYGSTGISVGNPALDRLIATNGITGMLPTVFLVISASAFGGVLFGSGMLQSLTNALQKGINRTVSIVASTVGTGIFANMITGDQYLSIILTGSLYKNLYKEKGLEPRLLSRSVEDSATVCSVLIPWNSCGMTQATVLKVATLDYLPYCFFNILSPLMSILMAATGYKIYRKARGKEKGLKIEPLKDGK